MNTSSKRLVLALAIALGSAGLHAAETPTAADQARLREDLRAAQQQLAEVSKRVAELSMEIGGDPARVQMFRYLGNPDRAVIGVILGESNRDGVGIEGVTPGGPAEKAGLRAGDTISAVGGKPVRCTMSRLVSHRSCAVKAPSSEPSVRTRSSRRSRIAGHVDGSTTTTKSRSE